MDGKPVLIELIDAKTKEHKETLEVSYIFNIFDTLFCSLFSWIVLEFVFLSPAFVVVQQ